MKKFLVFLLIYFDCKVISIQNDSPVMKECPRVKLMQPSISMNLIDGIWYEISKHSSSFTTGSCIVANLTILSNKLMSFTYSQKFDNDVRKTAIATFNATILKTNLWSCRFSSLYGES
jgi:hypothetical protein